MAEIGVSQVELVEPREDNARKLPQYIAALSGTFIFIELFKEK